MIPKTTRTVGTVLTSSAVFKDKNKVIVIPYVVRFVTKDPAGLITSVQVSPTGTKYERLVTLSLSGLWTFRWDCSGDYATADEFSVFVTESTVV